MPAKKKTRVRRILGKIGVKVAEMKDKVYKDVKKSKFDSDIYK